MVWQRTEVDGARAEWEAAVATIGALWTAPTTPRWRFGPGAYVAAVSSLDRTRSLAGAAVETPWDPDLAAVMNDRGRTVYEEQVVGDLLADL